MARTGPVSLAVKRQWLMLRLVPRAPRKIDARRLQRLLEQDGVDVTVRSIQRDLESLSEVFFDLSCDRRSKPYGWSWDAKSPLLEIPNMGVRSAVTFELVRQYLASLLPRVTWKALEPHFKLARGVLRHNPLAKMGRWPGKVRVVPRGLPFATPDVPPSVLDPVYEALLEERKLAVRYRKRGAKHAASYEVSPLGLVTRNGTLVLVCTTAGDDEETVKQMLLHRMSRAEIMDRPAVRPRGFRLDDYIDSGALGFRRGGTLKLKALVHEVVAVSLHEAPISADQQLRPRGDGWAVLKATVTDTVELRTWLQGHGAYVEVLGPKKLRHEFAATAQALHRRYQAHGMRKAAPPAAKGKRAVEVGESSRSKRTAPR